MTQHTSTATNTQSHNELSGTANTVLQTGNILGGLYVHVGSPEGRVPRQLPGRTRGFTGRTEQLDELDDALTTSVQESGLMPILCISGAGGVGKTTLAVHWAHGIGDEFPDGHLYVDLRGYSPGQPVHSGEALAGFLRALGVETREIPDGVAERAALYRSLLSGRRTLVVLDNAADEEQVRPLLPGEPSCLVVITSRRALSGLAVHHGAEMIELDLLPAEDAAALLRALVGASVDREPDAAAALVRQCGGLPLALRIVAERARSRPKVPLSALAEELATADRLDALDTGDDSSSAVRTVFSWSYRHLPDDAARMFRLLGLQPGTDLDVYAAASLVDTTPATARRLLRTLTRAHLVTEHAIGRFTMHDLLRAYATELAQQDESADLRSAAQVRVFDYYLHTAEQTDTYVSPHRFRTPPIGNARPGPRIDTYERALEWLDTELANITALFHLDDPVLDVRRWQLAHTLRGHFFLTKDWDPWIETHELALAATRRLGDKRAEATTHNNLGLALLERGDPDAAAAHYQRAQRLFEDMGDLPGASNAIANHAWILHDRGDSEAALRALHQALDNYQQIGAQANAGITLRGIAVFQGKLGQFTEAIEHLGEAMAIFTALDSQLDAAMAMNCLGEIHRAAGDALAAQQAHKQALAISQDCGSRFEQARALRGLGHAAAHLGDLDGATKQWHHALELYTGLGAKEARDVENDLASVHQG